jgi:teichuronic acid biosynthesis glycosyltransferase TuaG
MPPGTLTKTVEPRMVNDLVSIVMPAYNASSVLRDTVTSVQRQTYVHWELLIADDCSKDATRSIAEEYAACDNRIRLIALSQNSGPAGARQAAIDAAKGRFIAFLDSDDLWLPGKLERQVRFMQERGAALSFTAFRRISADGSRVGRILHVPAKLTYRQLLGNTAIATSTAMIDVVLAGPFRMIKTYYDDFALWLEITRRGFAAWGLDEDLVRYRVLGGSVSRNKARSAVMVWRTYRDVERLDIARSSWYFTRYALNAFAKYRSF